MKRPLKRHAEMEALFGADFLPISKQALAKAPAPKVTKGAPTMAVKPKAGPPLYTWETTWQEAKLDYPGTKLTWALWSYDWRPAGPGTYALIARATDGEGAVQELDEERPFKSGTTGFHRITIYVT